MLTLTQKRPQSELVQILKSTKNTQVKKAPKVNALRYLDAKEMDQHMQEIHDRLFRKLATEQDRAACLEIAKGFTYTIPYVDIYLALMALIKDRYKEAAKEAYGEVWQIAPKEWRNHILRGAERYTDKTEKATEELRAFVNRQAGHLNALNDEQAELVMNLESNEIEAKMSTETGYYIEPAPREEAYLLTCKTIAINLAIYSMGALYLTPLEVEKELSKRGFLKGDTGFYVRLK
jgi:hypothetical protein